MTTPTDMLQLARTVVATAKAKGAQDAAASVARSREVEVAWRDGRLEKISEATSRGLSLRLYVDGRYSAVSTSDLRPNALERFIADSVALARVLEPDPFRALPEPELYQGQASVDLQLEDPAYGDLTAEARRKLAEELEAAARAAPGADKIVSVTASVADGFTESWRVHSNGFEGARRDTTFWASAQVSVKDADGKRPEDYDMAGGCFLSDVPGPEVVGRKATERTLRRLGAKKGASAVMNVAVDNRVAGRLFGMLIGPMSAGSLQQRRSMFEGKLGQKIGSDKLEVIDDPLVPRGLGSRLYDSEGIAAKRFPLFEKGVLKTYYVDTYYGRKLKMAPTTGGPSNFAWKLGEKSQSQLLADLKEGLLITSFLGGNSNGTSGEFSLGIRGFMVRGGQLAEPVAEMNLSGNNLEFWNRLAAVGNDPYPYSSGRTPTLVFEGVQIAGT